MTMVSMTLTARTGTSRRACRLAWLVWLALTASSPAAAQTGGPDDSGARGRIRRGALHLTPSVQVDRIGIETNVFNSFEPESDFVTAVTPRLDTRVPIRRRARLATTITGGVEHYRTFAGERSFNPGVNSRLEVLLRRFAVSVGGDYLRTRRRFDQVVDLRARRTVSAVDGRVSVRLSPKLGLAADVMRERWRFDADALFDGTDLAETLNRDERTAVLALRWRRTALSTFTLATELREARFVQSPNRDSDSLTVTAGGEFHPRALISGSGFIGVRRFSAVGTAVTDATPLVARADLSYRLPTSTTVTFEVERDLRFSYRRDDPTYLIHRYGLAVTPRLDASFDLTGRVVRDAYDHRSGSGRQDRVWSAEGSVGFRAGPTTRIGFRVGYRTRRSDTPRWRYKGLEAGLVFDYGVRSGTSRPAVVRPRAPGLPWRR